MSDSKDAFLLYFGCWDEAGHFLYDRHKRRLYASAIPRYALGGQELDGSRIFLPRPEVPGEGRLTYLIREGDCVTVLAWWDRTFDKRGACNAAIQCSGWETFDYLWVRFSNVYPSLAAKLTKPWLALSASGNQP